MACSSPDIHSAANCGFSPNSSILSRISIVERRWVPSVHVKDDRKCCDAGGRVLPDTRRRDLYRHYLRLCHCGGSVSEAQITTPSGPSCRLLKCWPQGPNQRT